MDSSRESQTSTNTSEVEESFNCLFLLSIRYYYFAFIISFLQLLHYLNLETKPISLQKRLLDHTQPKLNIREPLNYKDLYGNTMDLCKMVETNIVLSIKST